MLVHKIVLDLKKNLPPKRFKHSEGVAKVAIQLAKKYARYETEPFLEQEALMAAWLHDCARVYPTDKLIEEAEARQIGITEYERESPILLHAILGVHIAAQKYEVRNSAVLGAVACHTLGRENMTKLDKIIYLADMIEPNRDFDGVEELRALAEKDLDQAVLAAMDHTIEYIKQKGGTLHPQTLAARASLAAEK